MEFITILLSGLLTVLTPVNLIADKVTEGAIRARFNKIEQLKVRIDNAPNYQLIQGKVEQVRIAGRGLWLTPDIRIGALDVETDPINIDLQRLRQKGQGSPRASLRQPIQAGVRLVLTQADINKTLQSPAVIARLRLIGSRLLGGSPDRYDFRNPQVEFLGNKRLRFQMELLEKNAQPLAFSLESGLGIIGGHSLQLIEPAVLVNGKPLSPQLVAGFTGAINKRLDLRTLEEAGIIARLLKLDINAGEMEVATFVRVDATAASTPSTGERRP